MNCIPLYCIHKSCTSILIWNPDRIRWITIFFACTSFALCLQRLVLVSIALNYVDFWSEFKYSFFCSWPYLVHEVSCWILSVNIHVYCSRPFPGQNMQDIHIPNVKWLVWLRFEVTHTSLRSAGDVYALNTVERVSSPPPSPNSQTWTTLWSLLWYCLSVHALITSKSFFLKTIPLFSDFFSGFEYRV